MHHSLHLYGKHQHRLIHLYISLAGLTRVPVVGYIVRWAANLYARIGHSGYLLSLNEAEQIIDFASDISLGPCSCRQEFHNCDYPVMSEIVIGRSGKEVYSSRVKEFRNISKEDAKDLLRKAHRKGLLQSIMRCGGHFYSICSCCTCCCVPMRLRKEFGIELALVRNPNVVNDFKKQKLR